MVAKAADRREPALRSADGHGDRQHGAARRHEHARFDAQTANDRHRLFERCVLSRHPRPRGFEHSRRDAVARLVRRTSRHDPCRGVRRFRADLEPVHAEDAIEHRARPFDSDGERGLRRAVRCEHAPKRRVMSSGAAAVCVDCVTGSGGTRRAGYRHEFRRSRFARDVRRGVVAARTGLQERDAHRGLRRGSR